MCTLFLKCSNSYLLKIDKILQICTIQNNSSIDIGARIPAEQQSTTTAFIQANSQLCGLLKKYCFLLDENPNGLTLFALLCALRLWTTGNHRKAFTHQIYSGSMHGNFAVGKYDLLILMDVYSIIYTTYRIVLNWRVDVDQSSFGYQFAAFLRFHGVNLDLCRELTHSPSPVIP
jgi:hypothetical protein